MVHKHIIRGTCCNLSFWSTKLSSDSTLVFPIWAVYIILITQQEFYFRLSKWVHGMDKMESVAQESRAERIAHYKAERRRELAERYGSQEEELPSKWSRREREGRGVRDSTYADKSVSGGMNGGMGKNGQTPLEERPFPAKISNGCKVNARGENTHQNRWVFLCLCTMQRFVTFLSAQLMVILVTLHFKVHISPLPSH